jgi:hypothetical protein
MLAPIAAISGFDIIPLTLRTPLLFKSDCVVSVIAWLRQRSVMSRTTTRSEYPTPMYSKQLITIADAVIMTPGTVQHQPRTSIMEDGQNTCIRLVLPV